MFRINRKSAGARHHPHSKPGRKRSRLVGYGIVVIVFFYALQYCCGSDWNDIFEHRAKSPDIIQVK